MPEGFASWSLLHDVHVIVDGTVSGPYPTDGRMTLLSTLLLGAILWGPVWKDLEILTHFSFPGPFMMLGSTQVEASNSRLPCCLSQARSGLRSHLLSSLISELEIDQRKGLNHEWLDAFQSCRNYKINTNRETGWSPGIRPSRSACPAWSKFSFPPAAGRRTLPGKQGQQGRGQVQTLTVWKVCHG